MRLGGPSHPVFGIVVLAACVEPVEGPAPPEAAPADFLSAIVDTDYVGDIWSSYVGLTLMMDRGQANLFYVSEWSDEARYLGCAARCEEARFWVRGTLDSNQWASDLYAGAATAIDSSGTIHALYGRRFYATCPGHCDARPSWTAARIDTGRVSNLALATAANGQLHTISVSGELTSPLSYATCTAGCTNPANWQNVDLAPLALAGQERLTGVALDAAGRLHVGYVTATPGGFASQLQYATCATACLTAANWSHMTLDSTSASRFELAIATSGSTVHVVRALHNGSDVTISSCSATCTSPTDWQTTVLGSVMFAHDVAIATDGANVRAVAIAEQGVRLWRCSANCASRESWDVFRLDALRPEHDVDGFHVAKVVTLAIDSLGQPIVARYGSGGVKYFTRNNR